MTSGRVTSSKKPLVRLTFLDHSGNSHLIPLVLDTGFTGNVLLPERYVNRLGLSTGITTQGHLANGEFLEIPTGYATLVWQGGRRRVRILQLGTEPLLGMEFLWNHRITIDAVPNGPVTITPIGG